MVRLGGGGEGRKEGTSEEKCAFCGKSTSIHTWKLNYINKLWTLGKRICNIDGDAAVPG
jgi:hypothetical protein